MLNQNNEIAKLQKIMEHGSEQGLMNRLSGEIIAKGGSVQGAQKVARQQGLALSRKEALEKIWFIKKSLKSKTIAKNILKKHVNK